MDIEFEEMKEGICDEGNGTVEFCFDAVVKFEGSTSFVTGGEWNVLESVVREGDMFARIYRPI